MDDHLVKMGEMVVQNLSWIWMVGFRVADIGYVPRSEVVSWLGHPRDPSLDIFGLIT